MLPGHVVKCVDQDVLSYKCISTGVYRKLRHLTHNEVIYKKRMNLFCPSNTRITHNEPDVLSLLQQFSGTHMGHSAQETCVVCFKLAHGAGTAVCV